MPERTEEEYKKFVESVLERGVEYATKLGMYVIVDWHILFDGNPNKNKDRAIKFFEKYVNKYKDYENVIYEICNEPNGDVEWARDVKPYAEEVIAKIRSIDKDKIIIVGTPNWSQDVDIASNDKVENDKNVMYAVHFYASTHKEEIREKVRVALSNNAPIIVSEFSICDATGDGKLDFVEADLWAKEIEKHGLSFVTWALSNKDETASLIKHNCDKVSNWEYEDLTTTGKWFYDFVKKF